MGVVWKAHKDDKPGVCSSCSKDLDYPRIEWHEWDGDLYLHRECAIELARAVVRWRWRGIWPRSEEEEGGNV